MQLCENAAFCIMLYRIFSSFYSTVLMNTVLNNYEKKDESFINNLCISSLLNVLLVYFLFTLILSKRALRQFLLICEDIYLLNQLL